MKKQMNEALQWKGGDVPSTGQGRQFHMIDQEGLITLHIVEQLDVKMNIEKGEPKIWIDTKIHSMEQLVMTTDAEPSGGHVWTITENYVFWY
jgi:hypothetical protein